MTDAWKQQLDPPTGGLPRLIDAIQFKRSARRRRDLLVLGAAATVMVGVAVDHARRPTQLLRESLASALEERGRVYVENGAVLELPSTRPDVRMFVISQLPPSNE